jgi:para-nitrobenzyl esterase
MNKRSKREIVAVIMAMILSAAVFGGCGAGDDAGAGDGSGGDSDAGADSDVTTSNIADTPYGKYEGLVHDNGVISFLGVPFAKQPVGELRWKEPQPLEESDQTMKVHEYGSTPVQVLDEFEQASYTKQGEDCLSLNVWSRDIDGKKPTMVFIYGGGFVSGGTADPLYHGENFVVNNDVVMVSVNYRLGPFGFLDLSEIGGAGYEHSRNMGILDQVAALKWIKENIGSFGGDPDNITVFGESAGASSIMRLMSSELSDGLFHKAILQSGGPASIKQVGDKQVDRIKQSRFVASEFLKTTGKTDLDGLLELSAEEIQQYADELADALGDELDLTTWGCVADDYIVPLDVFGNIKDGAAKDVSILIGTNTDEINYFKLYDPDLETSLEEEYPNGTSLGKDFSHNKEYADEYIKAQGDDPSRYIKFCSEYQLRQPSLIFAELQSAYNDVYMYLWDWDSNIDGLGAAHAVELPFVFGTFDSKTAKMTAGENLPEELSLRTQATWAAFAASGNPGIEGEATWEKFDPETRSTMVINDGDWVIENDPLPDGRKYLRPMYEITR